MANTNPYMDGTVKPGDRLIYLKAPALKVRFKFSGFGPQVVCVVDEDCRHLVDGRQDFIAHRRDLAFVPNKAPQ